MAPFISRLLSALAFGCAVTFAVEVRAGDRVAVCGGTASVLTHPSSNVLHFPNCSVQWSWVDRDSGLSAASVVASCREHAALTAAIICNSVGAADSSVVYIGAVSGVGGLPLWTCHPNQTAASESLAGIGGGWAPKCGGNYVWQHWHPALDHPDWFSLGGGGGEPMGFWPEMTMENAAELFAAILVTWVLAWGFGTIIKRVLFNR